MEESKHEGLKKKELLEQYTKTKMEFLILIQKRFYDKISHVRVKALKKFSKIVASENIILEPFDFYTVILNDATSRMRDKAANVRKNALKLFSALVNKFAKQNFDIQKTYINRLFPSIQELEAER